MSNGQYPSNREAELYCNEVIAPDTKEFPETLTGVWHLNSYDVSLFIHILTLNYIKNSEKDMGNISGSPARRPSSYL